jgi:hypothetical protein
MKRETINRFLGLAILSLMLTQCGGAGNDFSESAVTTSNGDESGTTSEIVGSTVEELPIDDSTSDNPDISLDSVGADGSVLLEIHGMGSSDAARSFKVSAPGSLGNRSLVTGNASVAEESADSTDQTEDFHAHLRELEAGIDPADIIDQSQNPKMLLAQTQENIGDTKSFEVLSSFASANSYEEVTGVLTVQSASFKFYVDDRDTDRFDVKDLQALAAKFEAIIPAERRLFGQESDVNHDGKVSILFTEVVNKLGGSGGGIITGFFYAADLMDGNANPYSNEQEIIFTFVPDSSGTFGAAVSKSFAFSNIYPGVLPHEFQHVINYNRHVIQNLGETEKSFLNEAMSHLAEDIYSLDATDFMAETGIENPSRVATYLSSIDKVCFSCGSKLAQRGGSYLFLRYLYEQAELGNLSGSTSGAELIDNLLNTTEVGIANLVQAAYGANRPNRPFVKLMGKFALAVYFSNTGVNETDENQFLGINLRATQDDNRGTILNGPSITTISEFPSTEAIQGSGICFVKVPANLISAAGGTLNINFNHLPDFAGSVIHP